MVSDSYADVAATMIQMFEEKRAQGITDAEVKYIHAVAKSSIISKGLGSRERDDALNAIERIWVQECRVDKFPLACQIRDMQEQLRMALHQNPSSSIKQLLQAKLEDLRILLEAAIAQHRREPEEVLDKAWKGHAANFSLDDIDLIVKDLLPSACGEDRLRARSMFQFDSRVRGDRLPGDRAVFDCLNLYIRVLPAIENS